MWGDGRWGGGRVEDGACREWDAWGMGVEVVCGIIDVAKGDERRC